MLREKSFEKLKTGDLFSCHPKNNDENIGESYFLVVEKMENPKSCSVIILSANNVSKIIKGEKCETFILGFENMSCLSIRNVSVKDFF